MSRVTTSSITAGASGGVQIQVNGIYDVIATVGFVPSAIVGVLSIRFFDLMDHHRKAVANNARDTWAAGRRAQRFVFAYSSRYGSMNNGKPRSFRELVGESFLVGPASSPGRFWEIFEEGGQMVGSGPMTVPIGPPGSQTLGYKTLFAGRTRREFARYGAAYGLGAEAATRVAERTRARFDIVNRGSARGLLVETVGASGSEGIQTLIRGVLRRAVRRRPILKFRDSFDRIWPKHSAKIDRVLERALTKAGQAGAEEELRNARAGGGGPAKVNQFSSGKTRTEYDRNLRRYLAGKDFSQIRSGLEQAVRDRAAAEESQSRLAPRERIGRAA